MRPIKFRAWAREQKQFAYLELPDGRKYSKCSFAFPFVHDGWEQFTGLHDKNGREIYEGDLLEMFPGSGAAQAGKTEPQTVIWSAPCFNLQRPNGQKTFFVLESSIAKVCEVIGNIHENPELLK